MKKMRKRALLIIALAAMLLLLCGFDAQQQKVYDLADLLTREEESTLQEKAVEAAYRLSLDVVMVTTNDAMGRTSEAFADEFYDGGGFGFEGKNGSGMLFCIDMDNREIYLSTAGDAISRITDYEVEKILDAAYDRITQGDYYGTFTAFLSSAEKYATNREEAENITGSYDPQEEDYHVIDVDPAEKSFLERILDPARAALDGLIAAVTGAIGTLIMKRRAKPRSTITTKTYQHGNVSFRERRDMLMHTTVSVRHIQRTSGSSGGGGGGHSHSSYHSSSGGHFHGGGGRKF